MRYEIEFDIRFAKFSVEANSESEAEEKIKSAVFISSDDKIVDMESEGEFELLGLEVN